jgi:uncharacterized tellurite resistance protein B-like protein
MFDALKRLLERAAPNDAAPPAASATDRDHDLRVATAALLFEIVRADGTVDDAERTVLRAAIQSTFELTADGVAELLRLAEEASARAVSLYEFTQVVRAASSPAERKRIVELLWLVAFADGRKDPLEEHMIRKVAGLLDVSQPDFIDAKLRARSAGETPAR